MSEFFVTLPNATTFLGTALADPISPQNVEVPQQALPQELFRFFCFQTPIPTMLCPTPRWVRRRTVEYCGRQRTRGVLL